MSYILKQYDTELMRFNMEKDIDGVAVHILSVIEDKKKLFPLDMELTDKGVAKWLKRRTIVCGFPIPFFTPFTLVSPSRGAVPPHDPFFTLKNLPCNLISSP